MFLDEIRDQLGRPGRHRGARAEPRRRSRVSGVVEQLPAHGRQSGRGARADADERGDRRPRRAAARPRADAGAAPHRRSAPAGRRGTLCRRLVPGARFVELPGDDHLPFLGDQDAILDESRRSSPSAGTSRRPIACSPRCCGRAAALGRSTEARCGFEAHVQREVELVPRPGFAFKPGEFSRFDGPARAIGCAARSPPRVRASAAPGTFGLHTGECDVTPEDRGLRRRRRTRPRRCGMPPGRGAGVAHRDRPRRRLRATFEDRGGHPLTDDGVQLAAVSPLKPHSRSPVPAPATCPRASHLDPQVRRPAGTSTRSRRSRPRQSSDAPEWVARPAGSVAPSLATGSQGTGPCAVCSDTLNAVRRDVDQPDPVAHRRAK